MINQKRIRKLAEKKVNYPLLSFYLNCDQTGKRQLKKTRVFIENFFRKKSELVEEKHEESFQEDKNHVLQEFERVKQERHKGLIIFCSSGAEFWNTFQFPVSFQNKARLGRAPYLVPLLKINEELSLTACVLLDSEKSRIYLVNQGEVEERESEGKYSPSRFDAGGWAQMRYQRRMEEKLERNLKEVRKTLDEMAQKEKIENLVLGGEEELRKKFEKKLSSAWKKKLEGDFSFSPQIQEDELTNKVGEILSQDEKKEEGEIQERIIDSQRGRSLLGNTLRALNEEKVQLLVVIEDFEKTGYQCEKSGLLFAEKSDCPGGGDNLIQVNLEIEAVRQAILQDAELEVNKHNQAEIEGLGAIVRY